VGPNVLVAALLRSLGPTLYQDSMTSWTTPIPPQERTLPPASPAGATPKPCATPLPVADILLQSQKPVSGVGGQTPQERSDEDIGPQPLTLAFGVPLQYIIPRRGRPGFDMVGGPPAACRDSINLVKRWKNQ